MLTVTDAQMHEGAELAIEAPNNTTDNGKSAEVFFCTHGNHWVSRTDAYYPKSANPSICKVCAAKRKEQNRKKKEEERIKQEMAVGQIPPFEQRGGTKRSTFSLSRYTLTALDILAVGRSVSEVVEEAIIHYLAQQDSEVIAFVGRMYYQNVNK